MTISRKIQRARHYKDMVRHYFVLLCQYQMRLILVLKEALLQGRLKKTLRWLFLEGGVAYLNFIQRFENPTPARGPTLLRGLNSEVFQKLGNQTKGLHSLLNDGKFSYSILIPVYKPDPEFFRKTLESALDQSAPEFEVLAGFDGPQPDSVRAVCDDLLQNNPRAKERLKIIEIDRSTGGGISRTTNALAQKATGKYLLFLDHDDWIRCDLLLRYEQTLRNQQVPEKTILSCNEFKIDTVDSPIYNTFIQKPNVPEFPYLFANTICHCLLVPKNEFEALGGLRSECDGAQDFDLCLRAEAAGLLFQNVPIYLYAWRVHAQSTAMSADIKDYATPAGIRAMVDYCASKKLDWTIERGLVPTWYRAIPALKHQPKVHAIMLFKDLKDMTLKAAKTFLAQKDVSVFLTCVDNNSSDASIADELRALGVEVISIPEPFNFSRLNNSGLERSQAPEEFDSVLFLNNDVELEPDAVAEMARWLDQPKIGCVGARLLYPSGRLQHGGTRLHRRSPHDEMRWDHVDCGQEERNLTLAALTRVCDAVTGACLLMKKSVFESVGKFDALNYPIAYSDTDLCLRLRKQGLFSLYTPYAKALHYESASRKLNSIEDFEQSRWLEESLGRL